MILSWLFICFLATLIPITILTTVVFCFWSVYLLDMIHRKWKIYKKALRCMQGGDSAQQLIIFTSRTEFVKFVFLFIMNLIEWLALLSGFVIHTITLKNQDNIHKNVSNNITLGHSPYILVPNHINDSNTMIYTILISPKIYNICFAIVLILFASLCTYLSARYAQKSWIKSNTIPYLIGFFLLYEIIIQILASFCTTFIIASWCDNFLLIASMVIAIKKYKELVMIINWSIVDLRTSNSILLLKRQVNMEQMFSKSIKFLGVGVSLLIAAEIIYTISYTLVTLLRENTTSSFRYLSICEESHFVNPKIQLIFPILYWTGFIIAAVGSSIILIPYIGCGLFIMCVTLWRLIRGKTGYRTHFNYGLLVPLYEK